MALRHAARARALAGTKFRPQGRTAEFGLDCIGLAALTYGVSAGQLPTGYRLRGHHEERLRAGLGQMFRRLRPTAAVSGDLLLCRIAADQLHLAIKTDVGFVHADAARHRVLEVPGDPPWPAVAAYRAKRNCGK